MDRDDPAYKGQSDYTPLLLRLYDPVVIGPVARYVWRCPIPRLVDRYREHIRDRHLDVGPGTGWFIDRSGLTDGSRVTILDPNQNVLRHAARRLHRLEITAVEADVGKPLPIDGPFASAAMSMVIHCLRRPWERKAQAVANVAAVLEPDGVFFGATVLGESAPHSWLARRVLHLFNRQGGFDNLEDSEESLHALLSQSFEDVWIEPLGSVAAFAATRRRPPAARSPT
jgi:SAM-dependent methyltransferase